MSPPSQDDFPVKNGKARLFLAYVTIIKILGDITECCLRKSLVPRRRLEFENALFRWIKRLRTDLQQPASGKPSDQHTPETRQLLVAYFAILAILYRSESPLSSPPAASLVASSLITGVFEEFLARDEIRHLGPVFAFYALCAGLAMVPAYRYPSLRRTAEYEISVIKLTLQELSKQWASAHGSLCALNKVIGEVQRQSSFNDPVPMVAPDVVPFFEDFGPVSCRQWKLVVGQQAGDYAVNMGDSRTGTPSILPDLRGSAAADRITPQGPTSSQTDSYAADNIAGGSPVLDLLGGGWEGSGFDWSGSWLLSDWGMNGINPGAAI